MNLKILIYKEKTLCIMEHYKKEEIDFLKENYPTLTKDEILKSTNRSWSSIQKKCHFLKIKKRVYESKCNFNFSKILSFDNESCYWIGFILADGHISTKYYNIQINLSIKDKNQIYNLEKYIGNEFKKRENNTQIRMVISDKPTIMKLIQIFNWKSNKTKNPPDIPSFITDDKLFSLIVGFIDGDGSISKKGSSIRIKCDKQWKNILENFYEKLTNEKKDFNLTSEGCSYISINKIQLLKNIKNKALELNLPIMNRKWDRIIDNRILKQDKYFIVQDLLNQNFSEEEIMEKTHFSYSLIHKVKRNLIENFDNQIDMENI